jgi:hypothetical protein
MAKKFTPPTPSTPAAKPVVKPVIESPVKTTVARNTPVPRADVKPKKEITHEAIAKKAYEIFVSGKGGSQVENWLRAERELKSL